MTDEYLLRCHTFFYNRVCSLKEQIRQLHRRLTEEEYKQHDIVKLAVRIKTATLETIPKNPDRVDYKLMGGLKKFRRYKQGLKRYRIIFCFANSPKIVVYLYINDEKHLRKSRSKKDPYSEFCRLMNKGYFSHNPLDPKILKWIRDYKF